MTAAADARSAHILVVDDAEGTRTVIASWLKRAGHQVWEAATGREALDLVSSARFELVVLDVHLPDMSGLDVCEQIKSSRATNALPVLHISATATGSRDRSQALNRGADGYLIEPIERDELLANVAALLRYHDARRTSERLAARLERLHESTLLVNAATTIAELTQYACSGLTSVFGLPSAVFVARDDIGYWAATGTNEITLRSGTCAVADILAMAQQAEASGTISLPARTGLTPPADANPVAAPLVTPRGDVVGVTVLLPAAGSPEDNLVHDHFSQALAVAFENQRLYTIEHQMALTLQRAMLPQAIPQPAGLEIAVRYQAVSDTAEVGGDFYEVFPLENGRTLLAVGDIAGHSLQAATAMAELRSSLRAFASIGLPPREILVRLGPLLQGMRGRPTATVCIAVIDTVAGTLEVTNAGHLPPMIRVGPQVQLVTEHGPLLGLLGELPAPTVTLDLPPGATILLYSDGLVESRTDDIDTGLANLAQAFASAGGSTDDVCTFLLTAVVDGPARFDDVALLAARVSRPRREHRRAHDGCEISAPWVGLSDRRCRE